MMLLSAVTVKRCLAAVVIVGACCTLRAETDAADAQWFDDEDRLAQVGGAELKLLPVPPAEAVHHHDNMLRVDEVSLQDGWVRLEQCHTHLDPVERSEVVYNAVRVRELRVLEFSGIGAAWVEGATVQLRDVAPGARLCVTAASRILTQAEEGVISLRNGPFMRRFLDGFFPMHVSMRIVLPPRCRQLVGSTPAAQPGFRIRQAEDGFRVEAWFAGELRTELRFACAPVSGN